jgi:hypothetical protein
MHTSHGHGKFLRVAARPHHQPYPTSRRLQEGEEHRGLLVFGEVHVFSVFDQTHHPHARAIPQLEIPADSVRYGAQYLACELPVHDCYARAVCVVMP